MLSLFFRLLFSFFVVGRIERYWKPKYTCLIRCKFLIFKQKSFFLLIYLFDYNFSLNYNFHLLFFHHPQKAEENAHNKFLTYTHHSRIFFPFWGFSFHWRLNDHAIYDFKQLNNIKNWIQQTKTWIQFLYSPHLVK